MKRFSSILIYVSFGFLIYYFNKKGFIDLRELNINIPLLVLSVFLLWVGFLMSALSWSQALIVYGERISRNKAIYSHGLQIFAKYIPGKIWTILGRASLAAPSNTSFKKYSFISLKEQLIYVWTGLIISIVPLLVFYDLNLYFLLVCLLLVFLTGILFNKWFHNLSIRIIRKVSSKFPEIPFLTLSDSKSIIFFCLGYWFLWMAAFYLMSLSLFNDVPVGVSLIFPLSVTIGLLAIIFPGGVGVRESILTGFMVLIGIPSIQSGTIAMFSRFWFIIGELLMFISAHVSKKLI